MSGFKFQEEFIVDWDELLQDSCCFEVLIVGVSPSKDHNNHAWAPHEVLWHCLSLYIDNYT